VTRSPKVCHGGRVDDGKYLKKKSEHMDAIWLPLGRHKENIPIDLTIIAARENRRCKK